MLLIPNLLAFLANFIILFFGTYLIYRILTAVFYESYIGSAIGVNKEQVKGAQSI